MRLVDRIDAWAEASRLNPYRLLVMRHPRLSDSDRRAFDELLDATPNGAEVAYDLEQPKWWFLHHAIARGFLLHGSNEPSIDEFRTRQTFDAHGKPINAVFATDDAIWPIYFAVVNRAALAYGYINWAVHVRGASRYVFSIGADPRAPESWTRGTIYLLPGETFRETPGSRELVSGVPVRPRARLAVDPEDFPFRPDTLEHGKGATPRQVVFRNARRPPRRRRMPA